MTKYLVLAAAIARCACGNDQAERAGSGAAIGAGVGAAGGALSSPSQTNLGQPSNQQQ